MDIERGFLEVLFNKIPYEEVYRKDKLERDTFCKYACEVFKQLTDDERINVFDNFESSINSKKGVNPFLLVAEAAEKLVTYSGNEVRCKYEKILRWRDISFRLGQDLFTTAYLAKQDTVFNQRTKYFAWSPIIKTDNKRLHNILDKGMAENHFHLNGSTQIFALSWASLMNNIAGRQKQFRKINSCMVPRYSIKTEEDRRISLYSECMTAAFIRYYLFNHMKDNTDDDLTKRIKSGKYEIDAMWVNELQRLIDTAKEEYGFIKERGVLDYALEKSNIGINNNDNRVLAGERQFLYNCFMHIFEEKFGSFEINCFYVYLIIKSCFRSELIQANGRLGFRNFSSYQGRKEIFIESFRQYQYELVRMAINSTMSCQKIVSLEARICPKKSGYENKKAIREYDKMAGLKKRSKPKLFYVLHFPKSPDKGKFMGNVPRNNDVRVKVNNYTQSIVRFLDMDGKCKYRVKGIDACSHEIGCRPEVFAQSFRYLTNFHITRKSMIDESSAPIELGATYHAGEDFLDIVDGLRAIDEAILFCNLKRGSRLGHALALGINALDYYELKNYNLVLSKQDIIDNAVWLLERSKEYDIKVDYSLVSRIEQIFYDKVDEVYGHTRKTGNEISIYEYYNAWKLRGDKPDIYCKSMEEIKEYLKLLDQPLLQSQYYEINRLVSGMIRENKKCCNLYYYYHYDKRVREEGAKKEVFKVDKKYANLINEIQNKMMLDISKRGIAIETNPSSNYLIGTIKKYEQHLIFRFNNLGIEPKGGAINESPLLYVSINTDDQGVFDTMLENEYALLAYALEKSENENGERKYNPETIYRWIDYVRNLGLEQTFK